MIRRQTICRVIYRDAKGRFVRPPEKPARVELEPLPKGEKGRFRVHKGGEVLAVEEAPRGVRVRLVPDASIRKAILEARARGDKATLRQIREWEREVKRLAAEDYLKAKRSSEWAKRMERAKQKSDASKGGKKAAANRRNVKALAERMRGESTSALMARYRRVGGDDLEKRAIAEVLKERGLNVEQPKRKRRRK
ncbi:hypothetical protein [Thermus brockianus]|uniref:Uncharacterized protein n=1 Tax=Thermus brockianus TaxID=56956 RepID=A0ABM7XHN8_THEBO|nr:hypothetical protein [Thermus brockianus]BDG15814.1 hypothetical protein TbrSNM41_05480 [Thermus brockianus]